MSGLYKIKFTQKKKVKRKIGSDPIWTVSLLKYVNNDMALFFFLFFFLLKKEKRKRKEPMYWYDFLSKKKSIGTTKINHIYLCLL